jgi:diguanylate cyclase (GGDEF)-like protein/PAS domain S-box-containing protein
MGVLASILLTECIVALLDLLLHGVVSEDYLLTGGIASAIVATPMLGLSLFFLCGLEKVERQVEQQNASLSSTLLDRQCIEAELRIAAVAFESWQSLMITDAECVILRVNQAFIAATGYQAIEVLGLTPRFLRSGRHDAQFYSAMWQTLRQTGAWQGEIWNRHKNGEIIPYYLSIWAVKNPEDKVTHFIATHIDLSQNKLAADEIERLAFYDPLTGLPNRRLLQDRLKQALVASERSCQRGALLFIDLDNFKSLNDSLGHDIGDLLLKNVAERLSSCVRLEDTVARLGGDEFVVVLENLSAFAYEAENIAENIGKKILAALSQAYLLEIHYYRSTSSIGATFFLGQQQSLDELLKQADIAMYQAKNAGRNAMRFFDPRMQAKINARVAMEADLRLALHGKQFTLHFQPQIYQQRIIGAEALIRWRRPEHGLTTPAEFIPLSEETGLILPIGLWVLEAACLQLKLWETTPGAEDLQLAVNISAIQFRQHDFVEQVCQLLQQTAIQPARLKLELTETMLINDIDDIALKMKALREIGVRFAMDDFGAGYSSLSRLTKLPIDQLKIDHSFIRDILSNQNNRNIVKTIITMADHLGMEVIAKGVETEAQHAYLTQENCRRFQGFWFGRPTPLAEFEALLAGNAAASAT